AKAGVSSPRRGSETILLTDDEPMIRNLGRIILQSYGYEVLLAADGFEALEIYRREQKRIALVVLDLTMPRLSGQDTLRQLQRINPGVRVLLASGYSADQAFDMNQERVLGFVGKPYHPEDLAHAVRAALDKPQVPSHPEVV